jgi:hypothetical protein
MIEDAYTFRLPLINRRQGEDGTRPNSKFHVTKVSNFSVVDNANLH